MRMEVDSEGRRRRAEGKGVATGGRRAFRARRERRRCERRRARSLTYSIQQQRLAGPSVTSWMSCLGGVFYY